MMRWCCGMPRLAAAAGPGLCRGAGAHRAAVEVEEKNHDWVDEKSLRASLLLLLFT